MKDIATLESKLQRLIEQIINMLKFTIEYINNTTKTQTEPQYAEYTEDFGDNDEGKVNVIKNFITLMNRVLPYCNTVYNDIDKLFYTFSKNVVSSLREAVK